MDQREPKDLQGLLRFAMELTKSEDAPHPSHFEQMDEERKKFLEEVLKSLTINVIEEFEKALTILQSDESTDDDKVAALESVQDFVDNIDQANNFIKIGGYKVIISCLSSKSGAIRKSAANLIAELCQNNPFCQEKFGNSDVFQLLITLLSDNIVATKAMHAISCMIRHHEPSLATFIELGGLECLLACTQSDDEHVSIKSCFLISSLSTEFDIVRDKFIQLNAIEKLSESLKSFNEFNPKIESILNGLNLFCQTEEGKIRFQKLHLRELLEDNLKNMKDKPECQEMVEYTESLLNFCPKYDGADEPEK